MDKLPGDRQKSLQEKEIDRKKLTSIDETKKSLPIYPYKEELIKAIKDHQVDF